MNIRPGQTGKAASRLSMALGAGLLMAVTGQNAQAQGQDFSQVEIIVHQLTDGIYYLEGSGGNIGVSVGDDGLFLVDDQYAQLSDRIIAALATLSDEPVKFILNTHHHGDHVGGNRNMAQEGAVIVAHENVRTHLAASALGDNLDRMLTADERQGLPVVTFTDSVDFHMNGQSIHAFHIDPAHTDGDSFVVFREANIIHTGDTFRTTSYPRVDTAAGGTFHGIVDGYETLLEISDAETVFLPGHGVPSRQDEVRRQLAMFVDIRDSVLNGIDAGMSLEEIQATQPTADYDAQWGGAEAGSALVGVIYAELMAMD